MISLKLKADILRVAHSIKGLIMIRVTYLSQATEPFSARALVDLLEHCREKNPRLGVTGVLIYANGTFLQVIEGDEAAVDRLMAVIERDSRHTNVKIVRRESVTSRQYSDWSMGFERVTDRTLQEIPGLRNFGLRNFNPDYLSGHGEVVETLLERHRAPHWDPLIREIDARDQFIADMRHALIEARQRNQQALLLIESLVEASAQGALEESHLQLCRRMI
ncbi:MAG: BLUF domain-containing protein, partial [Betaproteobacteria bacterium]|nr:BLUF domain-containing protein [Betaproteobacteria bacterium]